MKVSCQSCSAKYTIADEKVAGRVVKIRCKKCGATIVVNGNEMLGDTGAAAQDGDVWTLSIDDNDQRTMTVAEVVTAYRSGVVNDDTYCWKEGMDDWLPLRDVSALASALGGASVSNAPAAYDHAPPAGDLFGGSAPAPNFGGDDFAEQTVAAVVPAAAARRSGGRSAGGDLFGGAATAGGEEDVMTSAPALSAPPVNDSKLTGQRNENSVLFSLTALTAGANPASKGETTAEGDGSGLIDIRALSSSLSTKDDNASKVDDIMNLSGGGAFNAALTSPLLAPPPVTAGPQPGGYNSPSYIPDAQPPANNNKSLMFGLLGLGALILVAAIVVVVAFTNNNTTEPVATQTAPQLTATTLADPAATAAPVATAEPVATATAEPAATAAPSPTPVAKPNTGTARPAGNTGSTASNTGSSNTASNSGSTASNTGSSTKKPQSLADAMGAAAGKDNTKTTTSSSSSSSAPFDRGAASAALAGVNVQACKKGDAGPGHVKVTFGNTGTVTSAIVDGGPFQGTAVGGCIAGRYRGAKVPAFSGSAVTVGKSFTIN